MRFERVLCGDVMVREHTQLTQNKKFLLLKIWFNALLIFQFRFFLRTFQHKFSPICGRTNPPYAIRRELVPTTSEKREIRTLARLR